MQEREPPRLRDRYGRSLFGSSALVARKLVCGESDTHAASVKDRPISPADICATLYHSLGIDPEMALHDRTNRPMPAALGGQPIAEILA